MRLTPYTPDEKRVEAICEQAQSYGIWLGCQHVYTLEVLSRAEKEGAARLTARAIGWHLRDNPQSLHERLEEMSKRGFIQAESVWETEKSYFDEGNRIVVVYYSLTDDGRALLVLHEDVAIGPRLRTSALASLERSSA